MVVMIGTMTMTNPVVVITEYLPQNNPISEKNNEMFYETTMNLVFALNSSDSAKIAELAKYEEVFFEPFFQWIEQEDWTVKDCQLYPYSEDKAYVYIQVESSGLESAFPKGKNDIVATLEFNSVGEVVLTQIQPKSWFDQHMTVLKSEGAQLIENLHQFEIYNGFTDAETIPKPQVAAFCINEEYEDRTKSGEMGIKDIYIKPEWVEYAAQRYFGLENFSYTFDELLYDEEKKLYIYSPENKGKPKSNIIGVEEFPDMTEITVQIYEDPLQMVLDKTVIYTLKKDRG